MKNIRSLLRDDGYLLVGELSEGKQPWSLYDVQNELTFDLADLTSANFLWVRSTTLHSTPMTNHLLGTLDWLVAAPSIPRSFRSWSFHGRMAGRAHCGLR